MRNELTHATAPGITPRRRVRIGGHPQGSRCRTTGYDSACDSRTTQRVAVDLRSCDFVPVARLGALQLMKVLVHERDEPWCAGLARGALRLAYDDHGQGPEGGERGYEVGWALARRAYRSSPTGLKPLGEPARWVKNSVSGVTKSSGAGVRLQLGQIWS